ncbi:MAG: DUF1697 domain-containing protein [Acidobacteriota bacterium]
MRYVALLRGINVGGNNMIKMEKLRETVAELGFDNVKTYINSGNVIFDAKKTGDKKLAARIHDAILAEFGFDISVMVRSVDEIKDLIAANPFEGQFDNDKNLHAFFLNESLSAEQEVLLTAQASDAERFYIGDRYLLCLLTISILDSSVGKGFIDKKLKVATTARNWRTVKKLAEM